jgi:enoyl-CoA hydratase/carnithine racemase
VCGLDQGAIHAAIVGVADASHLPEPDARTEMGNTEAMSAPTTDTVTCDITAEVATITLDNPKRRNSLGLDTLGHLRDLLTNLGERRDVEAIVIAAIGPAFSAGHDMTEMVDRDAEYYEALFNRCAEVMLSIHAVPQPVVAKVDGVATAAGCQLVASCDLVVASMTSTFATPGVRIGLFCSTPMVALSRAVGRKRAMQMLLTGEPIDAATAADWGLVNKVVAADGLDQAVTDLVESITRFSAHTIGLGKRAFYEQVDLDEGSAYELTRVVMAANAGDSVAAEGITAFLDKRDPVWPVVDGDQAQR